MAFRDFDTGAVWGCMTTIGWIVAFCRLGRQDRGPYSLCKAFGWLPVGFMSWAYCPLQSDDHIDRRPGRGDVAAAVYAEILESQRKWIAGTGVRVPDRLG